MKNILVTGEYGGMGRAAVLTLKEQGFRVFALDSKVGNPEENIIPIETDITDEKEIIKAFETVKTYTDELFAIVHFAGVYMLDSLVEIENESFRRILILIFTVHFLSIKRFFRC